MERILFNVPEISPSGYRRSSFFLSMASLLKYEGNEFDYDFLLGVSLHAFRTNIHPEFYLSSMDPFTGFNTAEYLLHILGLRWETRMGSEDDEEAPITVMKTVDSINRKIPVVAIHLDNTENWGLITGYGDSISRFYGLFFASKYKGVETVISWPFITVILENAEIKIYKDRIVERALKRLPYILTPGKINVYYNGKSGIEYILKNKTEENEENIRKILSDLVSNRKSAYTFLKEYGKLTSFTHLSDIIELYEEESDINTINWNIERICKKILDIEEKLLDKF